MGVQVDTKEQLAQLAQQNLKPDEAFSSDALAQWAHTHGYMSSNTEHWLQLGQAALWVALVVLVMLLMWRGGYRIFGIVLVPDDAVGRVIKKFAVFGKRELPDGHIIATEGEAGVQAHMLPPGLYFWYWPWQFRVEIDDFVEVPQGQLGIVEAQDGKPMPQGQVLGTYVDSDSFQSATAFLENGGQRGPQLATLPPGTYRINLSLFKVSNVPATRINDNTVGVVTALEGAPLPAGDIAGKPIDGHLSFQDAAAFVAKGGYKGPQEQVLLAGIYYLNPLFVRIEQAPLTDIPIGHVGVVVSYVGAQANQAEQDAAFTHGNIVARGQRGVWAESLDPGRYPLNPQIMHVELVPTTNIVLNWAAAKSEAHDLDKHLSTITVRSGDGFTFNLDVSQIIHVSRDSAPKVIARFGTMVNLVKQVLEPTIGNYFRNSAQSSDVIDFLKTRAERQQQSSGFISAALAKYNVQAVDTLIGDIVPPKELMQTLTDRKLAEQRKITLEQQRGAEITRQEFEKAKSEADTRGQVVQAERAVQTSELNAKAVANKAQGEANARVIEAEGNAKAAEQQATAQVALAEGQAKATIAIGTADAQRTTAVGDAEAAVLDKKVKAVGSQFYAAMNMVDTLAANKVALVPQIVAGGVGGGTLVDALVGNLLAKDVTAKAGARS